MRLTHGLIVFSVFLAAAPLPVSAETLKGAARRAYEKATREGRVSTSCQAGSPDFVFWAGETPSAIGSEDSLSRSSSSNTGSATTSAGRIGAGPAPAS